MKENKKKIWIFNWSIEAYSLLIDEKMQETEMKVSNRQRKISLQRKYIYTYKFLFREKQTKEV